MSERQITHYVGDGCKPDGHRAEEDETSAELGRALDAPDPLEPLREAIWEEYGQYVNDRGKAIVTESEERIEREAARIVLRELMLQRGESENRLLERIAYWRERAK